MTLNEYAIKLGLSLNSAQIQFLDLIEERKDESLIITFPRLSGRQLMYSLVERKKGYDEGYEQGKADGAREFAEWLLVNHTLDCIECNSGDKSIGCKECANEYLAEWQKGEE